MVVKAVDGATSDNCNKQSYHCSPVLWKNKLTRINVDKLNNNVSPFFSRIRQILDEHQADKVPYLTDVETMQLQERIESAWFDYLTQMHEDTEYLRTRYGHKMESL